MDTRRLPNLGTLRAFEAAARFESFTRAADELFVTHGAVSHQIRALETEVGTALFTRHGKRLKLTEAGRRYAEQVRTALDTIAAATATLRGNTGERRLVVSTLPSFAARWLMPRIGRFIERHPQIDLELRTSHGLVDFQRDGVDVGVRLGRGDYPGLHVEKVMEEMFFPACSPLLNGGQLPRSPAELASFVLLPSSDEPWREWFAAAGVAGLAEPRHGAFYEDSAHLLEAAIAGHGVALVRRSLALDQIIAGRLVRLFDLDAISGLAYYLACPPDALKRDAVRAFRQWLIDESDAFCTLAQSRGITTARRTPSGGP